MVARVVPPERLGDIAAAVIAEEHLVLVVQRERRSVRRPTVDQLNVGSALIVPCRCTGLNRPYGGGLRDIKVLRIDVVDNLVCGPRVSVGRPALYGYAGRANGENSAEGVGNEACPGQSSHIAAYLRTLARLRISSRRRLLPVTTLSLSIFRIPWPRRCGMATPLTSSRKKTAR